MGPDLGQVNLAFLKHVAADPDWARTELKRVNAYNHEHGARYGQAPVPTSLKPNFISHEQEQLLQDASHNLWKALETFVQVFLKTPELQDAWGVTDEELDLYRVDPGYPGAIQVARFDAFLAGNDLRFLEFNCDSPGGAGYGDVIHEAFLNVVKRTPSLGEGVRLQQESRVEQLGDALMDCYNAWSSGNPERGDNPYVVLADWPDVGSRPDIDITVERLNQLGIDAAFADPRELALDGDELIHDERRVDLVYKRVITKELLAEPDAKPLLDAYRAGTVCMANAPRSVIVGNKRIMAALHRPMVQEHLDPGPLAAVKKHVPWTKPLREGTVKIEGLRVDLRDLLLANKDAFVLKPMRGYGGEDVHLGTDRDEETWGQLVDETMGKEWIVQRRVPIPEELYPRMESDEIRFGLVNVNVNPFVFGGRFAGAYTRISTEDVINVSHGGGLVPTITLNEAR